ncbi:phage tail-collar fiber domain-containing protein [Desulfoluna spongiiphila]|uniref:phage tail-collar fiber domain-containing protein n=1 Tax=Desulfoluna spongiiphila TaxID=419481 RepID=UPI0012564BA0|nr:phage tail protein [Desulfoluna spongiiphila]VVS92756.1 phage tail fibre protein [Desulfoluna spongiiphila]
MLRWTPAGLQAIQAAESSGTKIKATHIAIGDGGGQTPDHSGSTMLVNELYRQPIDTIDMVDAPDVPSGKVVEFGVSIPETKPETGSWMIREVAILADDTVIGIGPHPELEKVGKDSPKGTMTHTITAPMVVSNEAVISLAVAPSVHATMEALSDHNEDSEAHQDIRKACTTALSEHNRNDGAHEDIRQAHQVAVDEIAAQKEALETLEEKVVNTGVRQAVLSYGEGISVEATEVKSMDSMDYPGTGADNAVHNLGFDFISGENGGLLLGCQPTAVGCRVIQDTIRGPFHYFESHNAKANNYLDSVIKEFTTTGIITGHATGFNGPAGSNALAFHTTNRKGAYEWTTKSIIFDCENNWRGTEVIAVTAIEFLDPNGNVIPLIYGVDFKAYATTVQPTGHEPWRAFDTSLPKTGHWSSSSWLSMAPSAQRLSIVFTNPIIFSAIRINNGHCNGGSTDVGVKDIAAYISDQDIGATVGTTYGNYTNGLVGFWGTRVRQHVAVNKEDPQELVGLIWHFHASGTFAMGRYTATGGALTWRGPVNKKAIMFWIKDMDTDDNWLVYSDKLTPGNALLLNTSAIEIPTSSFLGDPANENGITIQGTANGGVVGREYMIYAWFGDDLGDLHPGMTGVRGATACVELKAGQTYDLGFPPETIILKNKNESSPWYVSSAGDQFSTFTQLQIDTAKANWNLISVNGNKISANLSPATGWILMAFGKNGKLPTGRSLQVKATQDNPFVATISDGFDLKHGNKDTIIGKSENAVYPQSESDGEYDILLLRDGCLNLTAKGSFVADFKKWKNEKLLVGGCTITDGLIVDLDLVAVGDEYETPWFPVAIDTKYILPNLFKTAKTTFEIWWNVEANDENKRYCEGQYYENSAGTGYGIGAYKRVNSNQLIVGTTAHTFYSLTSADPVRGDAYNKMGYYKLKVKRGY